MATVVATMSIDSYNEVSVSWALGNADTGLGADVLRWANKWVQAVGTFGGATITIQGSMDNTNWVTATTDGTTACTFVATGVKKVWEGFRYIRATSAGGAGTAATAILVGSA